MRHIQSSLLCGNHLDLILFQISRKCHPGLSLSLHPFLDCIRLHQLPLQLRHALVDFLLREQFSIGLFDFRGGLRKGSLRAQRIHPNGSPRGLLQSILIRLQLLQTDYVVALGGIEVLRRMPLPPPVCEDIASGQG